MSDKMLIDRATVKQALDALMHMCENTSAVDGYDQRQVADALIKLDRALAAPQPARGKWTTIPVDPTPEMLAAFKAAYKDGNFWLERIHGAVNAMLAAAPQPEQVLDVEGGAAC